MPVPTTNDDDACRRIWASVIIQALIDATAQPRNPSGQVFKAQARAWFVAEHGTTAQDFEEACLHANMDPIRVRNFLLRYDGPPLTLHLLSRMRDAFLDGDSDAN